MSNSKRALIILGVVAILMAIGYLKSTNSAAKAISTPVDSEYSTLYLVGYSTPIIVAGFLVWVAFVVVYRPAKKPVRKTVPIKKEVSHQIPAFENS